MSKLKAIIKGLLGVQYKMPGLEPELQTKVNDVKGKITSLIEVEKDEDIDTTALAEQLEELDKLRTGKIHNDSYGKGKKEELQKLEKQIREKLGIDDETLRGDALVNRVNEIIQEKETAAAAKGEVKDADVEKHPKFVSMVNDYKAKLKAAEKATKDEVDKVRGEYQKKEQLQSVGKDALTRLMKLDPVRLANAEAAAAQENRFLKDFEQYEFKEEGGKYIPYKDGEPLKDGHGNYIDFDTLVNQTAKVHFDFKVNEDRKFPEGEEPGAKDKNKAKDGDNKSKYTGKLPETEQDYLTLVNDRKIPIDQRREIQTHWDKKTASASA